MNMKSWGSVTTTPWAGQSGSVVITLQAGQSGSVVFTLQAGQSGSVATTLRAGQSKVRIPLGARDFSLLQNFQTGPGAHAASSLMGTGFFPRGKAARE